MIVKSGREIFVEIKRELSLILKRETSLVRCQCLKAEKFGKRIVAWLGGASGLRRRAS